MQRTAWAAAGFAMSVEALQLELRAKDVKLAEMKDKAKVGSAAARVPHPALSRQSSSLHLPC